MRRLNLSFLFVFTLLFISGPVFLPAQEAQSDYERAFNLQEKFNDLVVDMPSQATWIEESHRFWYRKSVTGGHEFHLLNADTLKKEIAFDHEKLAASLSKVLDEDVDPKKLPIRSFAFVNEGKAIEFDIGPWKYKCDLTTYECEKTGEADRYRDRSRFSMWERGTKPQPASEEAKPSPDGQWEAFIKNFNVYIRPKDGENETALSFDGSEGNYYTYRSLTWSPDSKKITAFRVQPGNHRIIQYIESSPDDQLQPKYHTMEYAKPGDTLDVRQPVLFLVDDQKQINIDNSLFPNPYQITEPDWREDSGAFTFEYNQRGHQVYRIIEVDAVTGKPRTVIDEAEDTFFCYSRKKFRYDAADGNEIIWMSERDGWNHLYLYDGVSGKVKNQITKGEWVVRDVEEVDEDARQIYFQASGINADQDPYFVHFYRINFDGTGLTPLTKGNFNHSVTFSKDMTYYVDIFSRVDAPPVMELRRTSDQKLLLQVEKTNILALKEAGWQPPEVFVSKARDGKTDIWGIINRPLNFDPQNTYPVIEYIYAGPHGSFVPKSFSPCNRMQPLAELGFIVVQIDGMGTNNRSKAFHDVCWKNLGDAGFPDRILWHKAVASTYSYYDISRVGIYGGSAGGQNTLGGLLFHPEFYKAGVSSCGCHDNRMDKIWWNEQWMGWPLGPHYAASSNVDNAHRLQGHLLLIVGELDTNVDPASTMQVVDALIKADKTFDLLVIPGGGHGMGGDYGTRKMYDFFLQHLQGKNPPNWNKIEEPKEKDQ
jgi:dipeptidyl aminopeptidase/acylaminoacyl peptidase